MPIHPITQASFDAYVETTRNPMVKTLADERAWFATGDDKVIGAVLFDKSDKDWNYVVMAKEEDGLFRCVAVNSCLNSMADAILALQEAMEKESSAQS